MNWDQFQGHERQRTMFERAISRARLGHAYLLTGPEGVGKRTFALLLAKSLLCQKRTPGLLTACGECAGCRQVDSQTHPDLMQVGLPAGKSELPIEVFVGSPEKRGREGLCHELSLSPMHGGHRIALIDDADKMNVASANALLKTLEEPGPGAILILIAQDPDQVIQTIRSRCQLVCFGALESDQVLTILRQQQADSRLSDELPPEKLDQAAQNSRGSITQAVSWLSHSQQLEKGNRLVEILQKGAFKAETLARGAEDVMSQFDSDNNSQRDGALLVLQSCLEFCHRKLTSGQNSSDISEEQQDAWAEAVELCLNSSMQIQRRAAVNLCLDAFYQDLENCLRPTWKNSSVRS